MQRMSFFSGGKPVSVQFELAVQAPAAAAASTRRRKGGGRAAAKRAMRPAAMAPGRMALGSSGPAPAPVRSSIADALHGQEDRLKDRFHDIRETRTLIGVLGTNDRTPFVPTETIAIEGAKTSDINWLRREYGAEIVAEGSNGKVLCRMPAGDNAIAMAFEAARELHVQRNVGTAHPNFLRIARRNPRSTGAKLAQWNLRNEGNPGVYGADVHADAAWALTTGDPDIRVAVLDEGVDTLHTDLKPVVVAERDFVDGNKHARPDGNDAHGTACAGIISSQSERIRGIARRCSLIAIRIAKGDGFGNWIFDDFETADAIDWAWREAKADVLSNSWGGGPPVDIITRAFERAMTKGRAGKGAIVVCAAGNDQLPIDFPATTPGVIAVGASNQWDQRKTRNSNDGENWGSNYGPELALLAPGVAITTTDMRGSRGYSNTRWVPDFNGTSAATPHVAAAAALMLSRVRSLTPAQVRSALEASAEPVCKDWNMTHGHGRLNIYGALRLGRPANG